MNIRPIISAPRAVALEGVKTKKIEKEVESGTREAADQAVLKKLGKLKEKQIVSATINTDGNFVAVELSRFPKNKISFVKMPFVNVFDINSPPVSIDYFKRRTPKGSKITENHTIQLAIANAETKAVAKDALVSLSKTIWKWLGQH